MDVLCGPHGSHLVQLSDKCELAGTMCWRDVTVGVDDGVFPHLASLCSKSWDKAWVFEALDCLCRNLKTPSNSIGNGCKPYATTRVRCLWRKKLLMQQKRSVKADWKTWLCSCKRLRVSWPQKKASRAAVGAKMSKGKSLSVIHASTFQVDVVMPKAQHSSCLGAPVA